MLVADRTQEFRERWRPTQEKVDLVVKTAIEIANPSRVFLFGSWARGEATIDSDLDLAVLLPDDRKEEIGGLRTQVLRALSRIPMSIDLIMATEGYAAEFLDSVNSVYFQILNEGVLVYDSWDQSAGERPALQSIGR